jgi:hypothetical protein
MAADKQRTTSRLTFNFLNYTIIIRPYNSSSVLIGNIIIYYLGLALFRLTLHRNQFHSVYGVNTVEI